MLSGANPYPPNKNSSVAFMRNLVFFGFKNVIAVRPIYSCYVTTFSIGKKHNSWSKYHNSVINHQSIE